MVHIHNHLTIPAVLAPFLAIHAILSQQIALVALHITI
jgi:hypothetical protein